MNKSGIFCDHCRKEIDQIIDYAEVTIRCAHEWEEVNLCVECFNKSWNFISKFCSGEKYESKE